MAILMGFVLWDATVDLKFVPCAIFGEFTSYGRNFLKMNTIIISSQHNKYFK